MLNDCTRETIQNNVNLIIIIIKNIIFKFFLFFNQIFSINLVKLKNKQLVCLKNNIRVFRILLVLCRTLQVF